MTTISELNTRAAKDPELRAAIAGLKADGAALDGFHRQHC